MRVSPNRSSWTRVSLGVSMAFGMALTTPLAEAWGHGAHRAVHARAIRSLPKSMRRYFQRHQLEMLTFAPDRRVSAEGAERRFAIDGFARFPFSDFPGKESAFKKRI